MSKDGKLLWQSFDIKLRSVAHILTELQSFFCGIYLPAITKVICMRLRVSRYGGSKTKDYLREVFFLPGPFKANIFALSSNRF